MPKIRTSRTKKIPDGYDLIEKTLDDLSKKMRDAENESSMGKSRNQVLWPIFKITHQKSRYIYDMYYKRKAISKELYDWCLKEKVADANLIAKWKKQGYEKLCCLRCMQPKDTDYGTTCICRVPSAKLEKDRIIECANCGCRGCCSGN